MTSAGAMALAVLASTIMVFLLCLYGFSQYVLLVPLALGLTIAMVRNAGFALIVLTVSIYMNASAVLADSHGIKVFGDLLAALVFVTASYHYMRGKRIDQATVPLVICIVYLITLAATALYARDPDAVLSKVAEGAKICVMTILLISLVHSMEQFQKMCLAVVFAASLMSLLTVLQYLFSNEFGGFALASVEHVTGRTDDWRPSGPLTDANFYAQILVIALPLALQILVSGSSWLWAFLGLTASTLISVALLLTFSRGGLIGAAASIIAVVIANRQLLKMRHVLIVGLVGCVGLAAVPSHYFDRFKSGFRSLEQISSGGFGEDPAIAGRASELRAAAYLAEKNPLLGVGYGQFKTYYQEISVAQGLMARGADREAHSLYLEILSERGVVGLSIFAVLMTLSVASIRKAAKRLRKQRRVAAVNAVGAWGAAMVGYLVTSAFLHESYAQYFWLLVMTALMLPTLVANTNSDSDFKDG
jgi:O-antigen ligase